MSGPGVVNRHTVRRRKAGRPPGRSAEQTRARILDAALDLFGAQGYGATSMSAVAAEAGLSMTGLVHHFPSKPDLLTAVLEARDQADMAELHGGGDGRLSPGWACLDDLAEVVARNATRLPVVRLFTMLAGEAVDADHPAHDWLVLHHDRARDGVAGALRAGQEAGTVAAGVDPEQVARLVVAVMDGLQVQWLAAPDEVDMVADFRAFAAGWPGSGQGEHRLPRER